MWKFYFFVSKANPIALNHTRQKYSLVVLVLVTIVCIKGEFRKPRCILLCWGDLKSEQWQPGPQKVGTY